MKYAFAAALLSAAQAVAVQVEAEAEWESNSYTYAPVASATARDPWNYQSSWSFDFDKIDDAAEEVYFGTDSESEINGETNDSWSSYEGYTDPNSDSSGDRTDGPQHRNSSSDESDCKIVGGHCSSDEHSHSSESDHDATNSHCHDSDGHQTDCSSSHSDDSHSSHSSGHSSSSHSSYSHSSSHSNDSSYPYSSESDGFHTPSDFGQTVSGYNYGGYRGNRYYAPNRYYVSSGW